MHAKERPEWCSPARWRMELGRRRRAAAPEWAGDDATPRAGRVGSARVARRGDYGWDGRGGL